MQIKLVIFSMMWLLFNCRNISIQNILRTHNMKGIGLLLLLLVCALGANDFYLDSGSVRKETYKWSMKLRNRKRLEPSASNDPVRTALLTAESIDKAVLHIKITDDEKQRWETPLVNSQAGQKYSKVPMDTMGFSYTNEPFSFKIKTNDAPYLLDTNVDSFVYNDKYLEFGFRYFSQDIMGIGERVVEKLFLCKNRNDCSYTLWGKDVASPFDDGGGGCKGTYGQQPFYMLQLPNKKFFGVFSFNTNDQDILIYKFQDRTMKVTHKIVGGIYDFYVFYPGTADQVIRQYHELVGRPYLIPRWSMGYHQCRYGWRTLDKVKDVVRKFEENDLPLDVVWADIDYMDKYADFTVDPVRYRGLKEFVNELHKKDMRWVPIVDAGIRRADDDKYYKLGEEKGAFIKSARTKRTLVGRVWPGPAVFISWYHSYGPELWKTGLKDFFGLVEYDGIWLDMNEIANFCRGECLHEENTSMLRRNLAADNHDPREFDNLPYRPGWCDLDDKTISMTGYHYSGNDFEDRTRKEYNTHSLWSLFEAKATFEFLADHFKKRPFILTRANSPGMGIYSTKWLGDNHSRWEYMRYSIVGVYNYQMFGIPLVGADMCGFMGNPQEELCARWMQLGAFYPFTRNHNDIHSGDKEPYVFGHRVITATKNAMRQKYSIMTYYYTKMFEASLEGGSVVRPLFFEFPEDSGVYDNGRTESMFMIGSSLLVVPVLYEHNNRVKAYCPNGNWYNLKDFRQVASYEPTAVQGKEVELDAGFDYVNVLLRGGSVIPHQETNTVRKIEHLKDIRLDIIVAPDHNGNANGNMILDDGISLRTIEDGKYSHLNLKFTKGSKVLEVTKTKKYGGDVTKSEQVGKIKLFGVEDWSGMRDLCVVAEGRRSRMNGNYHHDKKMLIFEHPSDVSIPWKDVEKLDFGRSC
eukprot:TRINITY_DN320_c0_g2_i1.p1 TRINITY_DN320_c0_g2~~TRINITY_DN320_c0_g2_i1.p1  ORF type:complete len:916 (-),score=286.78 TRINITY_DN320_c0_g2_i1:43-2790(-)